MRDGDEDANELERPNVVWIDPPLKLHLIQEYNRLMRKAKDINARIRAGDAPCK